MVERRLISIASQLQLLERLQHITYVSSSVIFVSGDSGAGKSTLIEQLSNKIPDNVQQVFIQLNEQLSDSQIRQQIITQRYEQALFDAQDNLFSSMSLLHEKQPSDVPCLIILDNARYLSQDLLLELLQITAQKAQFGDSEINILLLAEAQDNQKMLAFIHQVNSAKRDACLEFKLAELERNESNALLNHIFKQEAYVPHVQHQDALQKQLISCAGNPEKIIRLAEKISAGELQHEEASWLKTRLPAVLLMLVLLLLVAAIGNYLYPIFIKPLPAAVDVAEPVENENILLEAIPATQLTTDDLKPDAAAADLEEELAGHWVNKENSDIQDNPLLVGVGDKAGQRVIISDSEILNLAGVHTNNAATDDEPPADVKERQTVTDEPPAAEIKAIKTVTDIQPLADINVIQSVQPLADIQGVPDLQAVEEIESLKKMLATQPLQTVQQNKEVNREIETTIIAAIPEIGEIQDAEVLLDREYRKKTKPAVVNNSQIKNVVVESDITALETAFSENNKRTAAAPKNGALFTSSAQLLAVAAAHYTLQLSGMASEATLQQFISDYGLPVANVSIYKTQRNNKPWYVVIFGEYKSRQLAEQASRALPGSFAGMDTWIKKYQLVHQDLQLNNE